MSTDRKKLQEELYNWIESNIDYRMQKQTKNIINKLSTDELISVIEHKKRTNKRQLQRYN